MFRVDCDIHDFDYWVGGNQEDRYKADRRFLRAMLGSADQITGWFARTRRSWYRFWAWRYYWAVRTLGWVAFRYDQGKRATREDLRIEMAEVNST